jgi:dTDP-glucose pyrophosphorylase
MLYEAPLSTSTRSPPPEFQAVVLAGPGKDLYPLTPSTSLPKALLPVGNKPILDGVLRWVEEGGINGSSSVFCADACEIYDMHLGADGAENGIHPLFQMCCCSLLKRNSKLWLRT